MRIKNGLLFLSAAVLSAALFLLCYNADNKYTMESPQARGGMLTLTGQDLQTYPVTHLIMGWEIYRGRLLAPEDFSSSPAPVPDEYVFIGQYGGFEGPAGGNGTARNPHGSATYRLCIVLPPEPAYYMLEMPEIFSAYRLYINGDLFAQMGDPGSGAYRAQTGNKRIVLQSSGRTEIILAVSNYSHFYSGLVYPPAFGMTDAVEEILETRFAIRTAAVTLTLVIGLFYLLVWLLLVKSKAAYDKLPLLYVTLCACYAVFISYPVVKTLWAGGTFWNALEMLSYPVMLLAAAMIQSRVSGFEEKWTRVFTAFGVFVCCFATAAGIVMNDSLVLMYAYSAILEFYVWACALFMLVCTAYSLYSGSAHRAALISTSVVFGVSLIMNRLLPLFEPIRFGWFSEISGAVFVIAIGAVMAREVAAQFHKRLTLEIYVANLTRMTQQQLDLQREHYARLTERLEREAKLRHDMRHHLTVMKGYSDSGDAEKLGAYLDNLAGVQSDPDEKLRCENHAVSAVVAHYLGVAESEGVETDAIIIVPEDTGCVPAMDLCVIFGNLLENALEACRRMEHGGRFIRVRTRIDGDALSIAVTNSFDGVVHESGGTYLSRKEATGAAAAREGIGLSSVKAVCGKYRGLFKAGATGGTWTASALVNMH